MARVAGNLVHDDILGGLEFATKLLGARIIVVIGHTECSVTKGLCDGAQLEALTATLVNLDKPQQVQGGVSNVNPAVTFADCIYIPLGCAHKRQRPLIPCVNFERKGAAGALVQVISAAHGSTCRSEIGAKADSAPSLLNK